MSRFWAGADSASDSDNDSDSDKSSSDDEKIAKKAQANKWAADSDSGEFSSSTYSHIPTHTLTNPFFCLLFACFQNRKMKYEKL
jgi:hypothetical protein